MKKVKLLLYSINTQYKYLKKKNIATAITCDNKKNNDYEEMISWDV